MSEIHVSDNNGLGRFEAWVDGVLAGAVQYEMTDDVITLTHTSVEPAFEGKGVAGALARGALDAIRDDGTRKVDPQCPFIKGWIDKHPDSVALVAQ